METRAITRAVEKNGGNIMEMIGAYASYDYYYINHSRKMVCFNFKSKKRVKTKIINFLKKEHQEAKIIEKLKENDLKLKLIHKSKKYLMYEIVD